MAAPGAGVLAAMRRAVLAGDWRAVAGGLPHLPLRAEGERAIILGAVLRQAVLEALEAGDALTAVAVLRDGLPPLTVALAAAAAWPLPAPPAAPRGRPLFAASPNFPPLVGGATAGKPQLAPPPALYYGHPAGATCMPAGVTTLSPEVGVGGLAAQLAAAESSGVAPRDVLAGALASAALLLRPPPLTLAAATALLPPRTHVHHAAVVDADAAAPPGGGGGGGGAASEASSPGGPPPSKRARFHGGGGGSSSADGTRSPSPSPPEMAHAVTVVVTSGGGTVSVSVSVPPGDAGGPAAWVATLLPLDDREGALLQAPAGCSPLVALAGPGRAADLAALLVIASPAALRLAAGWSGAAGGSRQDLLHLVERRLVPTAVPPLRLPSLLGQALSYQRSMCALHIGMARVPSLLHDHDCRLHAGATPAPPPAWVATAASDDEVWRVVAGPRDGGRLATVTSAGEVAVWPAAAGTTPPAPLATWNALHDGHAAASARGSLVRWSSEQDADVAVSDAAWEGRGPLLATASGRSSLVCVWDAASGRLHTGIDTGVEGVSALVWCAPRGGDGAATLLVAPSDGGLLAFTIPVTAEAGLVAAAAPTARWVCQPVAALARPEGALRAEQADVVVALTHDGRLLIVNARDAAAPVAVQDVSRAGGPAPASLSPAAHSHLPLPTALALDATGRYALLAVPASPPIPTYLPGTVPVGARAVPPPPPLAPPTVAASDPPPRLESLLGVPADASAAAAAAALAPVAGRPAVLPLLPVPAALGSAGGAAGGGGAARATQALPSNAAWATTWPRAPGTLVQWDLLAATAVRRYRGHTNARTVLAPTFLGPDDGLVAVGSEDSCVYVWHRDRGTLLATIPGHAGAVNAVAAVPAVSATALASAGDDGTLRLLEPVPPPS